MAHTDPPKPRRSKRPPRKNARAGGRSDARPDGPRKQEGRRESRKPGGRGGVEQLDGVHAVREALRARRRKLYRLSLRDDLPAETQRGFEALAEEAGVPTERVAADAGPRRDEATSNPQGVWLEAGPVPELSLEALLSPLDLATSPRLVALDGVEDPQNVGAIARVADGAGAAGLILTERRAPPLTPALARASAGAIEWLPVARVTNLTRALDACKAAGFWVVGASPDAETALFEAPEAWLRGPILLVLGAEGRGLRPGIEERIDHRVRIPMAGHVDSLNVATAGAVLLFELLRRARP